MSASIWLLEVSADGCKTWAIDQSHGFYKTRERAEKRAKIETERYQNLSAANYMRNYVCRAREYAPVERAA